MRFKLDPYGIKPTRAHETDAGLDLYSPEEAVILPHSRVFIDTRVHIQIPHNFFGMIRSKSGLMKDHGILTDGVIDEGYTGSIGVVLFNASNDPFHVMPYTKIAQLIILPVIYPSVKIVDELEITERGDDGFESTGPY